MSLMFVLNDPVDNGSFLDQLMSWCRTNDTVYPKKYAHGFCFAVLCWCYTLTDFPISIRLTPLALWQSKDCPSASKATLMNMDKYFMWIHYERLHNHNKVKQNKTVCIFIGIYCIYAKLCLGEMNYVVQIRKDWKWDDTVIHEVSTEIISDQGVIGRLFFHYISSVPRSILKLQSPTFSGTAIRILMSFSLNVLSFHKFLVDSPAETSVIFSSYILVNSNVRFATSNNVPAEVNLFFNDDITEIVKQLASNCDIVMCTRTRMVNILGSCAIV